MKKKFIEWLLKPLLFITLLLPLLSGVGCATVTRGVNGSSTMIITDPPGAEVIIDGNVVGITPCNIRLPVSDTRISLVLAGYETVILVSMASTDGQGRGAMIANASGVIFPPLLLVNYGVDYITGAYKRQPKEILVKMWRPRGYSEKPSTPISQIPMVPQIPQQPQVTGQQAPFPNEIKMEPYIPPKRVYRAPPPPQEDECCQ